MSGFHEVRFPDNIAYGATGGPEFATTVVATGSGHEKRNVNWSEARGRWDVASGLKKQAQIDELIAFFRARRGKAYGFRFKDWTDYKATGQLLGTGDDAQTQFQLVKHYPSGSVIEVRTITKPVAGTVKRHNFRTQDASHGNSLSHRAPGSPSQRRDGLRRPRHQDCRPEGRLGGAPEGDRGGLGEGPGESGELVFMR
jgi:ribosomal protein L3